MGWTWNPAALDRNKRPDLQKMARRLKPAKVCTWLRKRTRKTRGSACYPGRIRKADRLDMLYYLYRRAKGNLTRPKLVRRAPLRRYKGPGFKSTLKARRATILKRNANQALLRKMRSRSRHQLGKRKPQVVRPRQVTKPKPVKRKAVKRAPSTRTRTRR